MSPSLHQSQVKAETRPPGQGQCCLWSAVTEPGWPAHGLGWSAHRVPALNNRLVGVTAGKNAGVRLAKTFTSSLRRTHSAVTRVYEAPAGGRRAQRFGLCGSLDGVLTTRLFVIQRLSDVFNVQQGVKASHYLSCPNARITAAGPEGWKWCVAAVALSSQRCRQYGNC